MPGKKRVIPHFIVCFIVSFFYIKSLYKYVNVHGLKFCPNSGNEKLGAKKEPDPDPTPYLFLTYEMKRQFSWILNIVFVFFVQSQCDQKCFLWKLHWMGPSKDLIFREGSTKSQKMEIFHDFCHETSDPPPLMVLWLIHFYGISFFCNWTLHIWKEFYTASHSKI